MRVRPANPCRRPSAPSISPLLALFSYVRSSGAVDVPDETLQKVKGYRVDHMVTGREVQVERDELYEMRPHHVGYGETRIRTTGEQVFGRTQTGKEVLDGSLPPIHGAQRGAGGGQSELSAAASVLSHRSKASSVASIASSVARLKELEQRVLARLRHIPTPVRTPDRFRASLRLPWLDRRGEDEEHQAQRAAEDAEHQGAVSDCGLGPSK